MATYNILIMGASYGSLLASKLLFGGHSDASSSACPPRPTSSTPKAFACACR